MSLLRIASVVPLVFGLAACASSIRVGGGESEGGKWEYEVLHVTELAGLDAQQMYSDALETIADPEHAARQCKAIEKSLNERAEEGWILVGMDQGTFVFRRAREE